MIETLTLVSSWLTQKNRIRTGAIGLIPHSSVLMQARNVGDGLRHMAGRNVLQ